MPQTWPISTKALNPSIRIFAERISAPGVIDHRGQTIIYIIVLQPMTSGSFVLNDCRHLARADAWNEVFGFDANDPDHNYAGSIIQVGLRLMRGLVCSESGPGGEFITIHY